MKNLKNNFLFGAAVLVVCNLLSKIIGAIYRIPLLKVLGSEGLGLYQLIFPIFAFMLVISSNGVNVALSKFVSRETAHKSSKNVSRYLQAGFIISFSVSIILTLIMAVLVPLVSKYQGNARLDICYFAILPSIVVCSLISTFKGYFLGKKEMIFSGGTQVVEQVLKLVFSLLFASMFSSRGMIFAVFGTVLGVTVSEVITLVFATLIYFLSKKKLSKVSICKIKKSGFKSKNISHNLFSSHNLSQANNSLVANNLSQADNLLASNNLSKSNSSLAVGNIPKASETFLTDNFSKNRKLSKKYFPKESRNISLKVALRDMFNFGFFVSLEGCIMPLTGAIDSLTVVPLLIKCGFSNVVAYTLFGLEDGIVASLVSMPTVFATSFGASLIPNIKQQNIEKSVSNIKESIKIVWLVGLASSFVFMFFSTDIVNFLYAGGLSDKIVLEQKIVEDLLKLNSLNIIYLSLLNLSISILQGLGDSKTPVLNLGICAILRIAVILMTLPVKSINIYGTAIADMVLYSVAFILNLRAIKKKLSISYSFAELFVFPAISCTAMCLTMQLFKNVLKNLATGRTITIIMALFGVFVYVSLLFITKVLDFKKLAKMIFKKRAKAEKT